MSTVMFACLMHQGASIKRPLCLSCDISLQSECIKLPFSTGWMFGLGQVKKKVYLLTLRSTQKWIEILKLYFFLILAKNRPAVMWLMFQEKHNAQI